MKVSVIMCAYNTEAFIAKAIESVLAQTYTNWELIISDDASQDQTVSIAEHFASDPRIRIIRQSENLGFIRNKNSAFLLATGELITQLDADDTCPPDRLEKQVSVFINHPDIQICGGSYFQIDGEGKMVSGSYVEYDKDFLITEIQDNYPCVFASIMYRREIVEQFGLLSEYFIGSYGEDHYWTAKVNKRFPIYFIKDVIYHYRINHNSVTHLYNNPRKLIADEIIQKLIHQQKETGTDWLEQGREDLMRAYEQEILSNHKIMSEKHRIWAAKALDKKDKKEAWFLLKKAIQLNPWNKTNIKTLFYYLKTKSIDNSY